MQKIVFAVSYILLIACSNDGSKHPQKDDAVIAFEDSVTNEVLRKFCLPYNYKLDTDSNTLFFYCSRYLDTSSFVHIRNEKEKVYVVFYTVLPSNHVYLNDYADPENHLLFFEGCSFIVDSSIWKRISHYAEIVVDSNSNVIDKVHLLDGSKYALYYNSQKKFGNNTNEVVFESFSNLLDSIILRQCYHRRTLKMHKSKS